MMQLVGKAPRQRGAEHLKKERKFYKKWDPVDKEMVLAAAEEMLRDICGVHV